MAMQKLRDAETILKCFQGFSSFHHFYLLSFSYVIIKGDKEPNMISFVDVAK